VKFEAMRINCVYNHIYKDNERTEK